MESPLALKLPHPSRMSSFILILSHAPEILFDDLTFKFDCDFD